MIELDSDLNVLLIPSLPQGYTVQEVRSEHDSKEVNKNAALGLNWLFLVFNETEILINLK